MLAPGLFFLAAGIGLLAFQLPDYVRAWKSRAWPKSVAEITSSETSYRTFFGAKAPASVGAWYLGRREQEFWTMLVARLFSPPSLAT